MKTNDELEDDEGFDDEFIHHLVKPECCEESKKHQVVFLKIPQSWYDGDNKSKPKWTSKCFDEFGRGSLIEVIYCPFCGENLPEVVKRLIPLDKNICTCNDGGYYCNTCKERLNCCRCLPPEMAWEGYTYNSSYPEDNKCKCGHEYYRHFDTYDDMCPVGCKYCDCLIFKSLT